MTKLAKRTVDLSRSGSAEVLEFSKMNDAVLAALDVPDEHRLSTRNQIENLPCVGKGKKSFYSLHDAVKVACIIRMNWLGITPSEAIEICDRREFSDGIFRTFDLSSVVATLTRSVGGGRWKLDIRQKTGVLLFEDYIKINVTRIARGVCRNLMPEDHVWR